jgi:putative heme-binding domain-containing protein
MPEELRQRPDLLDGNDCGRIYRIVAKNHVRSAAVKLSNKSSAALTELLAHPNAWFRETAARLLVERQDNSVREQLEDLTQSSAGHLARIHALWTLAGLGAVDEGLLLRLLEDDDARVVEHAILASEPKVPSSSQLERRIASLATHGDARVRYLALLVASPQPVPPTSAVDAWEETAMLIAAGTRGAPFLTQLLSTEGWEKHIADPHQYVAKVARLAALSQEGRLQTVIEALLANDTYRRNGLTAYLTEVVRRGTTIDEVQAALTADTRLALRDELEAARRNALDAKLPVATRCDAIDLLSLTADAAETLLPIALDEPHPEVRRRAIVALSKHSDLATWNKLIDAFSDATPAIQSSIVDGMLASEPRTSLLLEAIADGRINAGQLDANRTNQLVSHPDSRINARARQVLDDAVPQDRQRVLAEYQPVLTMAANASSGKKIFARQCATCHRIGDVGVDVGPDISDSRLKTPAQLLTDILQPNRAIDSSFFCVTAVTADGVVHTGVLTSETTTSITLRQAEGKVITLARDEIERIASDGVSLMPDGLERLISPQDMADLVSFIKNWRYLDDSEIKPSPALTSEVQRGNASPPVSAD